MLSPTKSSSAFVRPSSAASGRASGGFSLIEAMIVVAIVAIMAWLALPGYLEKIIRDQVVEALPLGDVAKAPIAKAWAASQPLPDDNAAAELPAADKIVNYVVPSVSVHGGAIDITFGNQGERQPQGQGPHASPGRRRRCAHRSHHVGVRICGGPAEDDRQGTERHQRALALPAAQVPHRLAPLPT